ncbi:MAG: hypothetical protein WC812_01090 [Candidatus Pacearchaeota archaeon]|jgi:hypothetical protein
MVTYSKTNIYIKDKSEVNLDNLKTELEIKGDPYYQNCFNPERKEFHYFMENSVIYLIEKEKEVDINIISKYELYVSEWRKTLEAILNEAKIKKP